MPIVEREFEDRDLLRENPSYYPTKFEIDPRKEFSAVYYPCEIDTTNNDSSYENLKRGLLFFDRIFVVVPELIFSEYFSPWEDMTKIDEDRLAETERFQTLEYNLWRERFRRICRFMTETKIAHEQGALVYVNPHQVIAQPSKTFFYALPSVRDVPIRDADSYASEILFHSIVGDLNDMQFRNATKTNYPYEGHGFAVFKGQAEINWLGMLSGCSNHEEDRMVNLATYIAENTIAPPPGVGFDAIVSPVMGMAVLLSHVMAFCIQNPVYPLTDSMYHFRLLSRTFERLSEDKVFSRLAQRIATDQKRMISGIGMEILDLELPRLDMRSFEDLLHIRATHKDQLERFRLELANFSQVSSSHLLSEDLIKHCREIAALRVAPALRDLKDSLALSRDKVIVDALKKVRSARPAVPLVAAFLSGIPLLYALAITAGLIGVEAFAELYYEKKKLKVGNGLNYLLGLKRQLQRGTSCAVQQ